MAVFPFRMDIINAAVHCSLMSVLLSSILIDHLIFTLHKIILNKYSIFYTPLQLVVVM